MRINDCIDEKYKNQLDDICAAGIDIGSRGSKAVLLYKGNIYTRMVASGVSSEKTAKQLLDGLVKAAGIQKEEITQIVGTGYGRVAMEFGNIPFAGITEISCHGMGAHYLLADTRTIIDIGGQDSKVINIDPNSGRVIDFVMNDKCAAGTGRFLEKVAMILEIGLDEMGELSLKANKTVDISSQCVVFAESEVITLRAQGESKANIAAGIHYSSARRVAGLLKRVKLTPTVLFTGGVSNNVGMRCALEEVTKTKIGKTKLDTVFAGALGAAIIAGKQQEFQ